MKRIISFILALVMIFMLAGCSKPENSNTPENTGNTAEAPMIVDDFEGSAETNYTTGTPWLDVDLEGVVTKGTPADLKDNFALGVNKDKIVKLKIPQGYSYAGTINSVVLQNDKDLKNMFLKSKAESHDAKLAMTLFKLMMDWESRNTVGVTPLKEMADTVEAVDSIDALSAYLGETPDEEQLYKLWYTAMDEDLEDSSRYVLTVEPANLLLDDSAEYETLTDYGKIKKEARSELAQKILVKLGYSEEEASAKIDNCFSFETELAEGICTNEEQRKPDYISSVNNHYSRNDFIVELKNLPILEALEKAKGFPESDDYVIYEPAFVQKLSELYTDENLKRIKDYLIVHGAVAMAAYMDRECYEWEYEARNTINGAAGMLDDATVFANKTAEILPWPVSRLYTETYLKEDDKVRISAMVDEAINAYHGILEETDFLSDTTRKNAIDKLDAMGKNILYPDSWEKYSYDELNIASPKKGGTLWEAMKKISAFETAKDVKAYPDPVDKEKWKLPPHVVNCFYYPLTNSIYIMGAMAQGDIYNSDMSDEELYAKVGTIIGHEISHAFDSSGSQFDKDGNMVNWWELEDQIAFQEKNEKMVAYYNAIHPWEGQDLYGSIMTGEACADMAGMKCMFRIAAEKEDFDYDKFFRSFADIWATKDSLERQYILINGTHPMNYLRINATLQQFDEFLDFYGITEGDNMYLAPEDRVAIW